MNRHTIMGRLGADPKEIGGGGAKFSVATTDKWKDKAGESHEETDWHDVLCFGQTAEFVLNYLKKSDSVLVEGKSKRRSYEDEGGVKKYAVEIKASQVTKIGR